MNRQLGLSMVELLIALAISSFLILGITQLLIDNKRNYLYQQGWSENHENGRFVLMTLEAKLTKAGYRRDPRSNMADAFPAQKKDDCTFGIGQSLVRANAKTLCIRYQPRSANEKDCAGNGFTGKSNLGTPYTNTFDSRENIIEKLSLSDDGKLICNGQELVEGIQAAYFDFGVSELIDTQEVSQYKTIPAASDIIRSLRYAFLLIATPNNLSQGITNRVCESDWKALTGQEPNCSPGKLFQMVGSSMSMRNLMP